MKEIGSLLFVLGRLIISYLEEWVRVFLNLAISKPVPSEQEESIERAIHFADGFHDGDWERDMEQEYIEERKEFTKYETRECLGKILRIPPNHSHILEKDINDKT